MWATSGGKHMRRHGRQHTDSIGLKATKVVIVLGALCAATACGGDAESSDDPSPAASVVASSVSATAEVGLTAAQNSKAAITLTAPTEGATVDRSFTVRGAGEAFEGTVLWKLTAADGAEVSSGYAIAGVTSKERFQFTVDAPTAGAYTLTMYRESAKDGTQTDQVTRQITVR